MGPNLEEQLKLKTAENDQLRREVMRLNQELGVRGLPTFANFIDALSIRIQEAHSPDPNIRKLAISQIKLLNSVLRQGIEVEHSADEPKRDQNGVVDLGALRHRA